MSRLGAPTKKLSDWVAHEARFREVFGRWANYRARVLTQTYGNRPNGAARRERIEQLAQAAGRAERLADIWSSSTSASDSMYRSNYLTEVVRNGETLERFLDRVIGFMELELENGSKLLEHAHDIVNTAVGQRLRSKNQKRWPSFALYEQYEYRLPRYDIPRRLELMVESSLYAFYVAWSPKSRIIIPDTRAELLRAIAVDEETLRIVTPRRFEELVAFIYERLGCRTILTESSGDWGADVLAWQPGPFGTESLIAVQAKLYSRERRVGYDDILGLNGAVTHYQAKHGHLVATADLTSQARKFMDETGYRFIDLTEFRAEVDKLLGA